MDTAPVTLTETQAGELRALSAELRDLTDSVTASRWQLARQMGMTFNGARDNYTILGYDEVLTAQQYRELYRRGGIAKRVVTALPKAVWRGEGELVEDEDAETRTEFEQWFYAINDRLGLWSKFQRAHTLASLSSFAVLLIGAPGDFTQEMPKATRPEDFLYVQPFGGGVVNDMRGTPNTTSAGATTMFGADVTVATWDEDIKSSRFGQPLTYNLRRTNIVAPELSRPVHWTRCVHIPSEGFLDDAIFGPPVLESVWNYFCDLLKIVGGGGEASWLRANPITQFDTDKDMSFASPQDAQAHVDAVKAKAEAVKHQLQRWIETRGVKVSQIGSNVADFSGNADLLLKLIAGTVGIPLRILTGSELGELASTQDRDNWNDTVRDCRSGYANPTILRPFIERLIAYGYAPAPKQWSSRWPELGSLTLQEQLDVAAKCADVNSKQGEIVFLTSDIRDICGRAPMTATDPRLTAGQARQADQLSINEKREATGLLPYEGDETTDPQADVPFGLLPRETLRITDPNVPANAPGGESPAPKLAAAEQRMLDQLEAALKDGGTVNIAVKK